MAINKYIFLFVGGSCGSFVKMIFHYYLYKLNLIDKQPELIIDSGIGSCHNNITQRLIRHSHWPNEIVDDNKVIIIDFDKDDIQLMAKLAFHKVWVISLSEDPDILAKNWDGKFKTIDDFKHALFDEKQYDLLIDPCWEESVSSINAELRIKFKDILFGDINGIISSYFHVERSSEIENFILQYREINKQYL